MLIYDKIIFIIENEYFVDSKTLIRILTKGNYFDNLELFQN